MKNRAQNYELVIRAQGEELAALKAENERLRAALEHIASRKVSPRPELPPTLADAVAIAFNALQVTP